MTETIRIDRRFCGPPDSGNGGYVAGLVARELGSSDVSVTLRLPPPLEQDLELVSEGDSTWLKDGEALIASAQPHRLSIDVPPPPSFAEAEDAGSAYFGFRHHNFPGCFVCGPERSANSGLRIFPGAIRSGQVAAIWRPDTSLVDAGGSVRPEFLWAALDCPGYWAVAGRAGIAVLGRIAARIEIRSVPGDPLIVTGWSIRSEGRKHQAGTALHDASGRLLAAAEAIWITLKD